MATRIDEFLMTEDASASLNDVFAQDTKRGSMRIDKFLGREERDKVKVGMIDYLDAAGKGVAKAIGSAPQLAGGLMKLYADTVSGKDVNFDVQNPNTWTYAANPFNVMTNPSRYILKKLFEGTNIDERLASRGEKLYDNNRKFIEMGFPAQKTKALQFVEDLGAGAISLGTSIGMGLIAGPITPGIAFGLYQKSDSYMQSLKSGKDYRESQFLSTILGLVEGGLEFWGIHRIISSSGGIIKRGIKGAMTEFIQEFSQEGAEGFIKRLTDIQMQGWSDIVFNALYAGAIGAVLGGGSGVSVASYQKSFVKKQFKRIGLSEETAARKTNELFNRAGEDVLSQAERAIDEELVKNNKFFLGEDFESNQKRAELIVKAAAGEELTAGERTELNTVYSDFVTKGLIKEQEEELSPDQKARELTQIEVKDVQSFLKSTDEVAKVLAEEGQEVTPEMLQVAADLEKGRPIDQETINKYPELQRGKLIYNTKEDVAEAEKIRPLAIKEQENLDSTLEDITKKIKGVEVVLGTATSKERAKRAESTALKINRGKIEGKLDFSIADVKDNVRSSVIVNDIYKDTAGFIKAIAPKGKWNLKLLLNKPHASGFMGIFLFDKLENGIGREIQIFTEKGWELKKQTDDDYRKFRVLRYDRLNESELKELKGLRDKTLKLYQQFYSELLGEGSLSDLESFIKAAASESDITVESKKVAQESAALTKEPLEGEKTSPESASINKPLSDRENRAITTSNKGIAQKKAEVKKLKVKADWFKINKKDPLQSESTIENGKSRKFLFDKRKNLIMLGQPGEGHVQIGATYGYLGAVNLTRGGYSPAHNFVWFRPDVSRDIADNLLMQLRENNPGLGVLYNVKNEMFKDKFEFELDDNRIADLVEYAPGQDPDVRMLTAASKQKSNLGIIKIHEEFKTKEFKKFKKDIEALRKSKYSDIKMNSMSDSVGMGEWQEDSVTMWLEGKEARILGFMAEIGKAQEQEAILANRPHIHGNDTLYEVQFLSVPSLANQTKLSKQVAKFFDGASLQTSDAKMYIATKGENPIAIEKLMQFVEKNIDENAIMYQFNSSFNLTFKENYDTLISKGEEYASNTEEGKTRGLQKAGESVVRDVSGEESSVSQEGEGKAEKGSQPTEEVRIANIKISEIKNLTDQISKFEKALKLQKKITTKQIQSFQKQAEQVIQKSDLDAADKGKFIKTLLAITDEKSLGESLPKIKARITSLKEASQKRGLVKKVLKQPKKPENIVDVKYQKKIDKILEDLGENKRMRRKSLKTMSVKQLEDLSMRLADLKEKGKQVFQDKKEQRKIASEIFRAALIKQAGGFPDGTLAKGSLEERKAKRASGIKKADIEFLRPLRMLRVLLKDSGERLIYDSIDQASTVRNLFALSRKKAVKQAMDNNGVTLSELGDVVVVNGKSYQVNNVLRMYLATKDDQSYRALLFGNNLTEGEVDQFIKQLEKEYPSYLKFADEVQKIVADRYNAIAQVMADIFNVQVEQVEVYFPLRRISFGVTQEELNQGIESEMVFEQALRKGAGFSYTSAEKGFTISRKEINDRFQSEISLDFLGDALRTIEKQEHLVAFGPLQRAFNKLINDKELQEIVKYNHSEAAWKWLNDYINVNVNPDIMHYGGNNLRWVRNIRLGLSKAYLGFNVVTAGKQFPSATLALKYTTPQALSSSLKRIALSSEAREEVFKLDPSLNVRVVSRDFDDLLKDVQSLPDSKIKRDLLIMSKTLDKAAFTMIMQMDKYAVLAVYDSVYRHQKKTKSEMEARDIAHKAVIETQPQGGIKDLPQIYRTNNEFLRMILMFSNQLNQTWNMMRADLPREIANKQFARATTGIASIIFSSTIIYIMSHGRLPEDPDDFIEAIFGTMVASIPILGNWGMATLRGYDPSISPVESITDTLKQTYDNVVNEEYMAALERASFLVAVWLQLPYSQARRTIKGIIDLSNDEADDIRRLIWSESAISNE